MRVQLSTFEVAAPRNCEPSGTKHCTEVMTSFRPCRSKPT